MRLKNSWLLPHGLAPLPSILLAPDPSCDPHAEPEPNPDPGPDLDPDLNPDLEPGPDPSEAFL